MSWMDVSSDTEVKTNGKKYGKPNGHGNPQANGHVPNKKRKHSHMNGDVTTNGESSTVHMSDKQRALQAQRKKLPIATGRVTLL